MKNKKNIIAAIAIILCSAILAIITGGYVTLVEKFELYDGHLINFILTNISITKTVIFFICYALVSSLIYFKHKEVGEFTYKYRFALAGAVFAICVLFQINGSSIGIWKSVVGNDLQTGGELLGVSRSIRADEWVVNTPFAISQEENITGKYQYFSDTIRGDKTDVFIVYGQPVYDISMIFRPFQLGYLLFGSGYGLAFFWCGRFIALFMIMFELGMLITKKKKLLSLVCALLIVLAPALQWWFAVNGLVEMIVFGGLAILLLDKYMRTDDFWKRVLYMSIIGICAAAFVLVFYPAWQIPMAYIIAGLGVWVIIKNRKECKFNKKDLIAILIILVVIAALLGNILLKSMDTIESVTNTAYPGARSETGGDLGLRYFQYPANMFMTVYQDGLGTNTCEAAVIFDLFPLGIILALMVIFKEKNKDPLLIILLIIEVLFGIWCVFGFPEFLAKISLLFVSPAHRTSVIIGILNVLILIRAMGLMKTQINKVVAGIGAVILTAVVMVLSYVNFPEYYTMWKIIFASAILVLLYYLVFRYNNKIAKVAFTILITLVLGFSSFLVNPIRTGIGVIQDHPVGQKIKEVNSQEPGLWIVEGGYPIINFPIMYGASTINSTNTYPNMQRWQLLDKDGKYENVYNRYAHITMKITENEETKFELLYPDAFKVEMPIEQLKTLNVKYILTSEDLEKFETQEINLQQLYNEFGMRIYEVEYVN